ncbi:thermonuclease family protein [Streptomyces sp. NPDC004126]|uniref:thermonuclease family protein n=1 Tax=Streptomyces sp. NPDC004126 TaxID=3390695 RepID=UPI003D081958
MSMLLIRGTFRAKGTRPDGDTISFTPDDVADWKLVPGPRPVVPRAFGQVSIRLEGVDALETHYGEEDSPSGVQHQPLPLAHEAADALLTALGFTDFHRDKTEKITSTIPETVPGYVLARGADVYGRCVALAGKGLPPVFNGYEIEVDERTLRETVNYQLVEAGLAYPTYYTGIPEPMRASLTAAADAARDAKEGVWARDTTTAPSGTAIAGLPSLTVDDGAVILPKLFRRLKDYFDFNPADTSLACFRAYLAGAWEDRYYLPGSSEPLSGLHHIVEVLDDVVAGGRRLRMTHGPTEVVFEER